MLGRVFLFLKNYFIYFWLRWDLVAVRAFSSCAAWGLLSSYGSVVWHTGLVAPRHVGSSRIRDWTCVSYTGRQILHHRATRKGPVLGLQKQLRMQRGVFSPLAGVCDTLSGNTGSWAILLSCLGEKQDKSVQGCSERTKKRQTTLAY